MAERMLGFLISVCEYSTCSVFTISNQDCIWLFSGKICEGEITLTTPHTAGKFGKILDPFVWRREISQRICQFILQRVAPLRGRIQVFHARAAGCWNNEEANQDGVSVCYFVFFSTKLPQPQMERGGFHGASASV